MSRPEPEPRRRMLLTVAFEALRELAQPDRPLSRAIDAEMTPGERLNGVASGEPVPMPRLLPSSTAVVVDDPAVFLDWAEQVGSHGEQHPLAGAHLDAATARAYATCPPPGCRAYPRSAALLVPVPAGHAIAERTHR